MKKTSFRFLFAITLITFLVSCSKDHEIEPSSFKSPTNNPEDTSYHVIPKDTSTKIPVATTAQDTISNFFVYFTNPVTSNVEVAAYEDLDGAGPKPAIIGGVTLKANTYYVVTFRIEDATNHTGNRVYIHDKIKNNGTDYKICISTPMGISVNPTDSDGSMAIGLVNDLYTSPGIGSDKINFSIKYQKGVKDGQCAPGTLYFNCNIPVTVN